MAGPRKTPYQVALYTTVTPIFGSLILLLNSLELYCLVKLQKTRQRLSSSSYIYIASLCVADITSGLMMIILKSIDPFMKTSLKGNVVAKEIYDILRFVFIRISLFLSILNLLALTIDRYFAAKHPIKYFHRKNIYHRFMVGGVWAVSVASVAFSYLITRQLLDNKAEYHNLLFPVSCYPTSVAFIVCYVSIYKVI